MRTPCEDKDIRQRSFISAISLQEESAQLLLRMDFPNITLRKFGWFLRPQKISRGEGHLHELVHENLALKEYLFLTHFFASKASGSMK